MAALNSLYRVAKRLVNRLPAWLLRFRPFGVYEIRLQQMEGTPAASPVSHHAPRSNVACQIRWVDQNDEPLLRRIARKTTCAGLNFETRRAVAAWFEGQVIACAFIATQSFEEAELGLQFELHAADAWLFAAVVDQSMRGQGVYGQLLEFLVDELGRQGMRRILLGVSIGNEPSRRAHARRGAIQIGGITAFRSFGLTVCRRNGQVQRLSPTAFSWARPIRLVVTR
jgi:GNAT superfamily N-acetyltransferase